ncbi:diacylglycerol/lipid kinase family protein [Novipirellula artificiosorum]|uniref:Diacylglycerol kinase n=1 Tax=Novipirellula artificiosorum TaxID=2528016 RepID=A0A5C6E0G0_9BACT|nr:diacylglycerol kinase family protein [Novipirellula artificiosorum]TWU40826.1 Diacylglycerol kinase [Novipirellula artificiosorum]
MPDEFQTCPELTTVMVCASPRAGSGKKREQIPKLTERLERAGFTVKLTDSIDAIRKQIAASVDADERSLVVVAAGGDGTVSLVAELTPPEFPIVPMPLGTENLLARHYGFSANAEDVFQCITRGTDHTIDAGRANGKLFLVMASCGFDAEVVRDVHLRRRGHIHRLSYLRPILRAVRKYRFPQLHIELAINGTTMASQKAHWAMTFNLPCYAANLRIEPSAIADDGKLDLITFAKGTRASGLAYVASVMVGRHLRREDVVRTRATQITIRSDRRVPYQLDGDYVGRLPLMIETLPRRVRLRMPPKQPSTRDVAERKRSIR